MRHTLAVLVALLLARTGSVAAQEAATSVTGAVVDVTGTAITGAQAELTRSDGTDIETATSDATGTFSFSGVLSGSYLVTVDAVGFAPFTTKPFTVSGQTRTYAVPPIVLEIGALSASIVVRPIEVIAAEQIKAQEQQRLLGVIPNFYVSYVPDAEPLTSRQKLSLALHETLDWTAFVGTTISAGAGQATNTHSGFGGGGSAYAKRWVVSFVDDRTGDFLTHYLFASLFHEDPRYFYQGSGTTRSRIVHALSSAFVARSDSGKPMPNYAYVFGNLSAASLSNTYYPTTARGADLLLTNVAVGLAGRAGANLIQEFVGKRLTKNVPTAQDTP
ncbi:MAG TPA: carboxypeptidase-like regulatory domain-containing protein [Vicinamibacterales bacterium]